MSTILASWRDLPPKRGALSALDPTDDRVWADRMHYDNERLTDHQTAKLSAITTEVEARCESRGAAGLVLTGSTARARRTQVSDLDYHVIGSRPELRDIHEDIDLYADDDQRFFQKLQDGDDFAHWTVWFGCIVFDRSEVIRKGAIYLAEEEGWPSAERKRGQAQKSLRFADELVRSQDYEAGLEQVRGALSLTARWWLLQRDVFPLARDELGSQLRETGETDVASHLHATIHSRPSSRELLRALDSASRLFG